MSSHLATASPCARPATLRGYATLVVALAAFLASMVVLRVPFRGYLIEGRLAGRLGDGLEAAAVEAWLKAAAPGVSVRVMTGAGGQCEVVLQQIAPRAADAQIAMDRAARQFAEQYVVQRHEAARQVKLSRLQAELRTARDTEDLLRTRLDELRAEQLAQAGQPPAVSELPPPQAELIGPRQPVPLAADDSRIRSLRDRLESLRVELASLLGRCTEQHPKVITLRSQIAGIERELAGPDSGIAEGQLPEKHAAHRPSGPVRWITAKHYAEQGASTALDDAMSNLAAATRARQWAERQLQTEVEAFSASAGFPWSIDAPRVLARVGGTPRSLTLLAAGLVTLVAGGLMFWTSAALVPRLMIQSADELTAVLALPLVGSAQVAARRGPRRLRLSPWLAKGTLHGAEILLAAMFVALAFTMISDRWLAGQVLIDPFGVLSEVAGRLL